MNNFYKCFKTDSIKPAEYNPREISDEEFNKLKESITLFGMCKAIIANANGIIIAGHQRTKAVKSLGIKKCPAFILNKKIAVHDEIRFNLMHNSVETESSLCSISNADSLDFGFNEVENSKINVTKKGYGSIVKEICKLLNKYGDFDSVIIDEGGKIIHNSDYAYSCKLLNRNLIVYKMHNDKVPEFLKYINSDYGTYNYKKLGIKPYVQTHCQMSRNLETRRSTLYEHYVLKNIKKDEEILDFGAGKKLYINLLKKKGYKAYSYEPYFKAKGTERLDVNATLADINNIQQKIETSGLFDVVILDSVLNSITSNDYEDYVLTSCNALLKQTGKIYLATRNKASSESRLRQARSTDKLRNIEFLDKDNFSAIFRKGVWTLQKFQDKNSLNKLLNKYFDKVQVIDKHKNQLWAICKKPKRFEKSKYFKALDIEFNLEYPNSYKHNKQKKIVETILNNH